MTIKVFTVKIKQNVCTVTEITCQGQVTVKYGKKEKEIMKVKVTNRLTYPEARKLYEQHKPDFTFAKVVQSMAAKPETKVAYTIQCERF